MDKAWCHARELKVLKKRKEKKRKEKKRKEKKRKEKKSLYLIESMNENQVYS
jgi:hypothetical protein